MYIHLNQFVFNWIGEARRLALPLWASMWTWLSPCTMSQVWRGVACDLDLGFWFNRKTHVHTSQPGIFQSTCKEISPWSCVCGLHRRIRCILHDFARFLFELLLKIHDLGTSLWASCFTFQICLTHKSSYKLKIQENLKASALEFFSECDCVSQCTGLVRI